jgi:DNA-binding winged helix-turn-helix (wHTH) protein/tetratricopeptide (TPR) repeat protein
MGQRAIPSWVNRHSYHSAEQTVKNKKLDHRDLSSFEDRLLQCVRWRGEEQAMPETRMWYFAPFRLDMGDERLWQGTEPVRLTAKAFAVLCHLVEHAGQLVTKDDLFAAVWESAYVSEAALAVCIGEIRRALGDVAQTRQYLETVRGRGYRFVAPVTTSPASPEPAVAERLPPVVVTRPELLVGREAAWAELHQRWAQARQGVRQVVFVTGEAGIGKTALVDAFVAQVVTERVWDCRGQCIEQHGVGEAYLPLLEALGRLGRAPGGDRLIALLHQQAPSWLVHLPALVSPETSERLQRRAGGTTRERMLRELTEAVEVLTVEQPLVLVLEDLHWSDGATLDWLAYVARRREAARLLVLGTYRPVDAIVRRHPVHAVTHDLQLHGQATEVVLHGLSATGVTAYLAQRFGEHTFPADLAGVLYQRTDGNPLFLATVVDDLVQQGVLRHETTNWTLEGELEAAVRGVPESLRQLMEQQFTQLSSAEQELLEAASVAGMEFAAAAVAAGVDEPLETVEMQCVALARRGQFVQARGNVDWPDGTVTTQYGFLHALSREFLYDRLYPSQRARWHQRIGLRLEMGYGTRGPERAAELADHFVQGRDAARAVHYLHYAGAQAVQRCAYQEAVTCFEHALQATRQLPEGRDTQALTIDLHLALRTALLPLGEYERILASLRQAEQFAIALDDQPRLTRVMCYMVSCLRLLGQQEHAMLLGQQILAVAPDDVALQVGINYALGQGYYSLGDFRRAQDLFHKNVALLTGDLEQAYFGMAAMPAVTSRMYLVYCHAQLGAFAEGMAQGAASIRLAEAAQHPLSLVFAQRSVGSLSLHRGDVPMAISWLEQSLALCQQWDIRDGLPMHLALLGYAYALAGRLAEALPLLEQAVTRSASMQALYGHAIRCARLSQGYLLAGRLVEARVEAQRAFEFARTHKERSAQAWVLHLLGDLAVHDTPGHAEATVTYYQQALALAEELGMRPLCAHCYLSLGLFHHQYARPDAARAALSKAIAMFRAMDMQWWLPQAEAALAQTV